MFMHNLEKCLRLFPKVYVSSDDEEILFEAWQAGAIRIERGEELCGDTPNIPVYQHALKYMDADAIVAVQANSPTVEPNTIAIVKRLMEMGVPEVMTHHPIKGFFKIYGSVWGISRERLETYGDPYNPKPEVFVEDKSVDIHTEEDLNQALCQ
jgi:CMP-N-acetylneuraminic acid synthetase